MEQVTTVLELMGMLLIASAVAAAIAVAGPDRFSLVIGGAVLGAEFLGISWLLNGGLEMTLNRLAAWMVRRESRRDR